MAEYQLYCFAQSGNAYRAALMLNLIGADWEPIFVDFFAKGETRTPEYRDQRQRDGRGAGAGARRQEAQPVGRDPQLSRRALRQIPPGGRRRGLEALRWIIFDNQKVNGFLGPYRFLRIFAKPAGDPAVLAFLKGRIDSNLAIVDKRLADAAVRPRRPADHRRPLAGGLSLLSGGGIRLRHPGAAQEHRGLARPHQGAAGLEASLRSDAGPSAAGVIDERVRLIESPVAGERVALAPIVRRLRSMAASSDLASVMPSSTRDRDRRAALRQA